jgi:hypothetical protein
MKTLIGYHLHTPETTGVRPKQERVFLGTPVHIPPPRRRSLDHCRVIRHASSDARAQIIAALVVCYTITILLWMLV